VIVDVEVIVDPSSDHSSQVAVRDMAAMVARPRCVNRHAASRLIDKVLLVARRQRELAGATASGWGRTPRP
jgi:hypothetical protein